LCNWHAAEAIKKRLIKEGYLKDVRDDLVDKIWRWIKSPTMVELATNRQGLVDDLRLKDRDYITSYYRPKERQFIKVYTRQYPNLGRKVFKTIAPLITHEAINLILREWNIAKWWYEDYLDGKEGAPKGSYYRKECDLPLQYGLPCACWLFEIVEQDTPIPRSLIHPRWLFEVPELVTGWEMSVDPSISMEEDGYIAMSQDEDSSDGGDTGESDDRDS
ncbi:hypothetical protein JMJ35_001046, partial [Cladonia borealis]